MSAFGYRLLNPPRAHLAAMMMAMMTVLSVRTEAHGSATVANSPPSVKRAAVVTQEFESRTRWETPLLGGAAF